MPPRGSWGASTPQAKPKPKPRAAATGGPAEGPAGGGDLRYPDTGGGDPSHPAMRLCDRPRAFGLTRGPPARRRRTSLPPPPSPRVLGHRERRHLVYSTLSPCSVRCGGRSRRLKGGPQWGCSPGNARVSSSQAAGRPMGPRPRRWLLPTLSWARRPARPRRSARDRRRRLGRLRLRRRSCTAPLGRAGRRTPLSMGGPLLWPPPLMMLLFLDLSLLRPRLRRCLAPWLSITGIIRANAGGGELSGLGASIR